MTEYERGKTTVNAPNDCDCLHTTILVLLNDQFEFLRLFVEFVYNISRLSVAEYLASSVTLYFE